MATRLYLTTKAPRVRIDDSPKGTWNRQSYFGSGWSKCQHTWLLDTTKTLGGELTTRAGRTNQQGNYDLFLARWMSRPLSGSGTLSGTFDFIAQVSSAWEDDTDPPADLTDAVWKVHVYVTVGETAAIRGTALSNYADSNHFTFSASGGVFGIAISQQTLTAVGYQDGDCIMVEVGTRVIASPTPTPAYPPTNQSFMPLRVSGCTGGFPTYTEHADMVAGDTALTKAPWCEFSANLSFKAPSAAPSNELCSTPVVVPSTLPYASSLVDTTGATGTDQEVFWSWTAPADGTVIFNTLGSSGGTIVRAFTGGCALTTISGETRTQHQAPHRSMSTSKFTAVQGTTYLIRVRVNPGANQAPSGGGVVKLNAFYVQEADTDDIYIPCGWLVAFRPSISAFVNFTSTFLANAPTSCAIDYTRRPMSDLSHGTDNTNFRVVMGLHGVDLLEYLDGTDLLEVNFMGDLWDTNPPFLKHPAQIHFMRDGQVVVGWYGNGYLFVKGIGTLPSILNTVSSDAIYSDFRIADGLHADLQAGAPWPTATRLSAAVQTTATPWMTVDEDSGIIYYISSGYYEPVGGYTVKRITTAGVQLPDLVTLTPTGTNVPSSKGLQVIGDSLYICNGSTGLRIDKTTGATVRTYTPSVAIESETLTDVKVSADGTEVYFFDNDTTTLFRFNIETGAETGYWPLMLIPGTFTQMAIYQESPPEEPEPEIPLCPVEELLDDPEPDSALERLFEVHGFGLVARQAENESGIVLAQSADPQFSGILGAEDLGEFVLGDEGIESEGVEGSGDSSCLTIDDGTDSPLRGIL